MLHAKRILCVVAASLVFAGCYRGYKSAEDLDEDDRGPSACARSCQQLGMQMTAFVLVEHQTSGCVCSPPNVPPPAGPTAAAAAAHVVIQRQEAQQQELPTQTAPTAP